MGQVSLREVRTLEEVCRLKRDHHTWGDWSISTDGGTVWISKQKLGAEQTDHIEIPKAVFDRLFDAYAKPRPFVRR